MIVSIIDKPTKDAKKLQNSKRMIIKIKISEDANDKKIGDANDKPTDVND